MRYTPLATVCLAMLAISLGSCGGGSSDDTDSPSSSQPTGFSIGGVVSGLQGVLMIRLNGGVSSLALNQNGAFSFPLRLASGAAYSVTVSDQPVDQVCSIENGNGTVLSDIAVVAVTCIEGPEVPTELATLAPGEFLWNVDGNVPDEQRENLATGVDIARYYLSLVYGHEIPVEIRRQIELKMVATGDGNTEVGGGGSCCTALAPGYPYARIFIDVLHPQWNRPASVRPSYPFTLRVDKWKTGAHEYVHAWQNANECVAISSQPLGDWVYEGMAEYLAYSALEAVGLVSRQQTVQHMRNGVMGAGNYSLDELEQGSPVWPGHFGYFGIDWLVNNSTSGLESLLTVCEAIADGSSVDAAFLQSFGITRTDFYLQYPGPP